MRSGMTTFLTILLIPAVFVGMIIVSFIATFPMCVSVARRHAIRLTPKVFTFLAGGQLKEPVNG
jgi:hypothetical protein